MPKDDGHKCGKWYKVSVKHETSVSNFIVPFYTLKHLHTSTRAQAG